ncbi:DUF3794 domain-containing protein [Clostridium uliginosum]|uniref:SipL SPOCS domain-containing protein n=1 Tax=Clostridium uliginosum TaxID=119641 RepID=A0A1I1L093_9CLOT|nr:DUF3794 domain-containing protein [Clostridium uliginosum]SFC66486.1 hypothetical protein SAMN05421842_1078 [Clostridium uliginosum]
MKDSNCYTKKILFKNCAFADTISLPACSDPIKEIVDYAVKIFVFENKFVKTCGDEKLMIKGYKAIKIRYLVDDCTGKVICKTFTVPFFELIPIPICSNIVKIDAKVSYCDLNHCDSYTLWFYNVITLCISVYTKNTPPIIHCDKEHNCSDEDWNFKNDCYPSTKKIHYHEKHCYPSSIANDIDDDSCCMKKTDCCKSHYRDDEC